MIFDGYIEWDVGVVAASVLIAVGASTAAFWTLFRLLAMVSEHVPMWRSPDTSVFVMWDSYV